MEKIKPLENAVPTLPLVRRSLTATRLFDLLSRLLPALFFLFTVTVKMGELASYLQETSLQEKGRLAFYAAIGSRVSVILFLALMVVLFLVRTSPVKKAEGIFPRVTAVVGTFFMSVITVFPRADLGLIESAAATLLVLVGTILSIVVLAQLGRSFSLMAEARRLVTTGPYAYVRHPLYVAEEIAILGAVIQFFSLPTMVILATHLVIQIQRMKNEEAVLRNAFPEYRDYETRTARLIPGVY